MALQARTGTRPEREYVLGTDLDELVRLGFQHQLWLAHAAAAWEQAGFGPGQRLLDIGCGPGYATFDLALLVGARGRVTAVDASARFIAHLKAGAAARGLGNIAARLGDVERLAAGRGAFDGAYARWVLCFVKRPEAVIRGVARALKRGGVFVAQDYFRYQGVVISPDCAVFRKFFRMVDRSWRRRGGDPDIGLRLPAMLAAEGFDVVHIRPLLRVARPGTPLWQWPDTFFANYLPALGRLGLFSRTERREFLRQWRRRSRDPAAFFVTPPMIEVIAVKR